MIIDYANLIVLMDTNITDMVMFHKSLRDGEATATGILYPVIHNYKEVQLGGGAIFPSIEFINGWTLQYEAGSWSISGGNLDVNINQVPNCYIVQTQSAAYAVTSADGGGSVYTPEEIADAVWEKVIV